MKIAIILLTTYPNQATIDFAQHIRSTTNFTVSIFSDKEYYGSEAIYLTDEFCASKGYKDSNISDNSTHIKKNPIVWDKALYALCEIDHGFDFVWIFEEDCFIPDVKTLIALSEKYSHSPDLVTRVNECNPDKKDQSWHWPKIYPHIEPPYYFSMVSACGMSSRMLSEIKKYVDKHGHLFYIESMFNTLAMQAGLSVKTAKELMSVVWLGDWGIDEFVKFPLNIFHPVKDIDNHPKLRLDIEKAFNENYVSLKPTPSFLL